MNQIKKSQKLYNIQWYKKGEISAQDYLVSQVKDTEILLHRHTLKEGRQWGITTPDNLVKITKTNKYLYEIILPERKRKLYFDVDCIRTENPDIIPSDLLNEIEQTIQIEFPGSVLEVSGSVTELKISYHITISNWIADTLEDILALKIFAKKYNHLFIDEKVYTSNRLMKLINQSKIDGRVQYYIKGNTQVFFHFITCHFNPNSININTSNIYKELVKEENLDPIKFNILEIPQLNMTLPELFDWNSTTFVEKLNIIPLFQKGKPNCLSHNNIKKVLIWSKQVGISFEEFWNWNKRKEDTKVRLNKWFDIWTNCNLNIGTNSIEAIIKRFYPKITENKSTKIFKYNFNIENEKTNSIMVDSRYLSKDSINPNTKYTILCSPMGSNKTGSIVENLNDDSVLWITPRVTLSENTLSRLNERSSGLHFSNYKDYTTKQKKEGKLEECGNVICSIQSLHYLQKDYSIIIVDEIETVLNTFNENSVTHGINCVVNWLSFKDYCVKAKKVFLMDAFTTKLTTNFIALLEPNQKTDLVFTSTAPETRYFSELESFDDWVYKIKESLKANKKLYIFTPFKNGLRGVSTLSSMLMNCFNWTDNKQIISYHSGKTKEKKQLYNCEKLWGDKDLKCIITNSCITVGVNFNIPDDFDEIYCYYTPTISTRDFIQSLYRVRKPKSLVMNIYKEKLTYFKEYIPKEFDEPNCEIFTKLKQNLEIERKANQNNFETLYFLCEKANIKFTFNRPEHTTEENRKEIKRLLKDNHLSIPWDSIKMISYNEMENIGGILNSNLDTFQQRLEYDKYHFSRMFSDVKKAKLFWDLGKKNLVEKINELLNNPNHIISRLYKNNNLEFSKPIKSNPILGDIKLNEIQEVFKFHNQPKDQSIDLIMKMVNAFFETTVVSLVKEKEGNYKYSQVTIDGKQFLKYQTNKEFLKTINSIIIAITEIVFVPKVGVKPKQVDNFTDDEEYLTEDSEDDFGDRPLITREEKLAKLALKC